MNILLNKDQIEKREKLMWLRYQTTYQEHHNSFKMQFELS